MLDRNCPPEVQIEPLARRKTLKTVPNMRTRSKDTQKYFASPRTKGYPRKLLDTHYSPIRRPKATREKRHTMSSGESTEYSTYSSSNVQQKCQQIPHLYTKYWRGYFSLKLGGLTNVGKRGVPRCVLSISFETEQSRQLDGFLHREWRGGLTTVVHRLPGAFT